MLKKLKSEAGPMLEFLGFSISSRDECAEVIAGLSLSRERVEKIVAMVKEMKRQKGASLASSEELAGELRSAQTAVMSRFRRAALRAAHGLICEEGGGFLRPRSTVWCGGRKPSPP